MKTLPTVKNFLIDHFAFKVPIENRICYIMCLSGTAANIAGLISTISLKLPLITRIIAVISLLIMIVLTVFGFKTKSPHKFSGFVTFVIGCIVFPVMFITEGGLNGGMSYYFILPAICFAYTMKSWKKYILLAFTLAEYGVLCYLSEVHSEFFFQIPSDTILSDKISGIIIVFLFIYFFSDQFARQNLYDRKQIQRLSDLYEQQANSDEHTGLYNRRYFKTLLEIAIGSSDEETDPLSLAMFDIDNFKKINDTYGHLYGDAVLKQFANILMDKCMDGSLACRYGGEEFLLLIPHRSHEEAFDITESVRADTERKIICDEDGHAVTVSAGFIPVSKDMTYDIMMKSVDDKLYSAKRTGKNKVVR